MEKGHRERAKGGRHQAVGKAFRAQESKIRERGNLELEMGPTAQLLKCFFFNPLLFLLHFFAVPDSQFPARDLVLYELKS